MRLTTVGLAVAMMLVAGTAAAAPGGKDSGAGGGRGGSGPSPGGAGPGSGSSTSAAEGAYIGQTGSNPENPDQIEDRGKAQRKPWEVTGIWETHRLIRQEDLGGAGPNKVFNYLYYGLTYDVTPKDRFAVRGGFYQRFIADAGETGFRADDIAISYTRTIPLPSKFTLRASGMFSVPISFASQKASLVTDLRATVGLSKTWGDLTVDFRTFGDFFWSKYTTGGADDMTGGNPNEKFRLAGVLSAEYRMPFHRPLSIGVALTDEYGWFYNVGTAPVAGYPNGAPVGASGDTQFSGQPMQQSYGGEVFVRYTMPELVGIKSDITIALANGDPTLGYTSTLHDGVGHPYLFYRQTAEVYGALTVRY